MYGATCMFISHTEDQGTLIKQDEKDKAGNENYN